MRAALLRCGFGIFLVVVLVPISFFGEEKGTEHDQPPVLSLKDSIRLALKNNPSLKISAQNLKEKQALWLSGKGVWDPVLEGNSFLSRSEQPQASSVDGDIVQSNYHSLSLSQKIPTGTKATVSVENQRLSSNSPFQTLNPSYAARSGLTLEQPLLNNALGIQDRGAVQILRADSEIERFRHQLQIETLINQVMKAYWQWEYAEEVIEVRERLVEFSQELKAVEEKRAALLVQPPLSLLQIRGDLLAREQDLEMAKQEAQTAKIQLNALLVGENPEAKALLLREHKGEILAAPKTWEDKTEALQNALQYRKDYLIVRHEWEQEATVVRVEANNRWPTLDVKGSLFANGLAGAFGDNWESLAENDQYSWDMGLVLSLPFGGREAKGLYRAAKARQDAWLFNNEQLRINMASALDEISGQVESFSRQNRLLEQRLRIQDERLRHAQTDYRNGRIDIDDLLEVRADVAVAQLGYKILLKQWHWALVDYVSAQGLLYEQYALAGMNNHD